MTELWPMARLEVMAGEDEKGYLARQKILQAEAKARMAAKFGNR